MSLERALTKLRYDESVSGYALLTNDGQPFLAFSLPEDTLPTIRNTLEIHSSSLKLMNVITSQGTVVLARVDANWVLAVLFMADVSLGVALQRTKNVIDSLGNADLPPPPKKVEVETTTAPQIDEAVPVETQATPEVEQPTGEPITEVKVTHGCIVRKGSMYNEASRIGNPLYNEMTSKFQNIGIDVLLMVDDTRTVFRIAEILAKRVELIISVVEWCVSKRVLDVECPEEQTPGKREIVELPLFEGELKKAKKEHRPVLELCDGTRTLQDIASELNIPYFKALQSIIPYRGKTLKIIMRDMEVK